MAKQELEFFDPEATGRWFHPEGYPEGIENLIIAECPKTGMRTLLSRWAPGYRELDVLEHDYWEEIYIIEGDMYVGENTYTAGMAAVRPPHMIHGPFGSVNGCKIFVVFYQAVQ